jgi:uncharacterized protein (DUF58 family)
MTARRATPLLAVAMVLAAAVFGTPVLYVPGFALLLAFAVSWWWVQLASSRAALSHEPGPRTVVEGEPYPMRVAVRGGAIAIPGGTLTHPLAKDPVAIRDRPSKPIRLEVTSARRGWQRLEPATLVVADPLSLASARVKGTSPPRVLVLPRVEDLVPATAAAGSEGEDAVAGGADGEHGAGLGKRALDFEVDGLRAYRPGTPASRIHWPILARTGELTERQLVGGGAGSPIVILDSAWSAGADALDRAVRAAASICFHLAPRRGCVLILPGERTPLQIDSERRSWPHAHARLALVEPGGSPPRPRAGGASGTVFWVNASGTVPRLPADLSQNTAYLVAAAPVDLDEEAFTVAGCTAHPLRTRRVRARAA